MKITKLFGCVLGLHATLIAVLLVQPGCQSTQPPTQTFQQTQTSGGSGGTDRTLRPSATMRPAVDGASRANQDFIPAGRPGETVGLDPAFNAGFEDNRYAPRDEFSEFEPIEPIRPLDSLTVNVAGTSMETYTVKKGDSLWSISKRYNVSMSELLEANNLKRDAVLRIGQQLQIPVEGSTATVAAVTPDTYQPTSFNQASTSYTVRGGDSLSKIARQFDTSVNAIKAANGKTSDMIRVGEILTIPVGNNAAVPAAQSAPQPAANAPAVSVATVPADGVHVVKAGEFPAAIARKYGMTTSELLATNGITDPTKLQVGQRLKVRSGGSAANVDSRVEVAAPSATAPRPSAQQPIRIQSTETIRVVEADPLLESDFRALPQGSGASAQPVVELDPFEGAEEIPVIRLED